MENKELNYKLYEESYKEYQNLKKKMAKFYLENLPREEIIKFLKKKKIIKEDLNPVTDKLELMERNNGNKYIQK